MTPKEAAVVLAKAATYDNRKPDAQAAVSWAHALAGIALADALAAVEAHYAESTDWVMPAHVRGRVRAIQAQRVAAAVPPVLPPELSGAEYAAALAEWRRQVASGGTPELPALVAAATRKELMSTQRGH